MIRTSAPLTQSPFYTTAFDGAVFDGAVRVYFARAQEDLALRVYHRLRESLGDAHAREGGDRLGRTAFLLLYPDHEIFRACVPGSEGRSISTDRIGGDLVVAVGGPLDDPGYDEAFGALKAFLAVRPTGRG